MSLGKRKLRILDLFCGAGGAGMGYSNAGFEVLGVDIKDQPNYPFDFVKCDALDYLRNMPINGFFDAIHASPPCQRYSSLTKLTSKKEHPDLVSQVREALIATGLPYIIENVPAARLLNPVRLCGSMFSLNVVRHRDFESNLEFYAPKKCDHKKGMVTVLTKSCRATGDLRGKSSHENGKKAMGIYWMTQHELGESIPPAYTQYVGEKLKGHILHSRLAGRNAPLSHDADLMPHCID